MKALKSYFLFLFCIVLLTSGLSAFAHGGEKHPEKDTVAKQKTDTAAISSHHQDAHTAPAASVKEFPNLHPLVVHFPIVLLILAALMQLIGVFFINRPYNIAITVILSLGFISAYLASSTFHAHTGDLPKDIATLFEEHEKWAFYAVRFSGVATVIKLISIFIAPKRWLEGLIAVVLLVSAVSVAISGHHGAELVHKYDVGPKGNLLESHHH